MLLISQLPKNQSLKRWKGWGKGERWEKSKKSEHIDELKRGMFKTTLLITSGPFRFIQARGAVSSRRLVPGMKQMVFSEVTIITIQSALFLCCLSISIHRVEQLLSLPVSQSAGHICREARLSMQWFSHAYEWHSPQNVPRVVPGDSWSVLQLFLGKCAQTSTHSRWGALTGKLVHPSPAQRTSELIGAASRRESNLKQLHL